MSIAPIAIVGCGCVLPQTPDVETFWKRLLDGKSVLKPLAADDTRFAAFLRQDQGQPFTKMPVGRIADYAFDWRRFRMPPKDAERVNPIQLMILDAGAQALDGLREIPKETTGLYLGATGLGWQADSGLRIRLRELEEAAIAATSDVEERASILARARQALEAELMPVTEDNVVGASASVGLGRIANAFDLRGPHYSVDSGYASALAALDIACRALRDGEVDLAVSGGASELLTPLELVAFNKMGALSSSELTPFDAGASGTQLSEGCVVFALKRLEDAEQAGDDVIAVIRGVGGGTDVGGRSILAPDETGQRRAMERALVDGDVQRESVRFVECHATGTPLGDATELKAVAGVYGQGSAPVVVGGAKAVFGHLRGGAGAVGLLKAALAAKHGIWPGQSRFQTAPTNAPHGAGGNLVVATAEQRLTEEKQEVPSRIGVTAVGFGGTTFHAVVEPHHRGAHRRAHVRVGHNAEPIAVVAMAGEFPGAGSAEDLRQMIADGKDATREVPLDRWDVNRFFDPDPSRLDTCYTKLGCFLDALPTTAEPEWKIPPSSLASLDPCQLLALRAAKAALRCLEDPMQRWDKHRVGVMLAFLPYQGRKFLADARINAERYFDKLRSELIASGREGADVDRIVQAARAKFTSALPELSEDSFTGWQGALCAGRISRAYGFGGPHLVTDSACASTHAALHAATQALRHRTCDTVLAGGVWADMMPEFFVAACRFNALSATGSTPFDEGADGFVPGEGAGVFVLRRLEDAVANDEPILAVLRSVAGSSDGKGSSVLAPTQDGEALAMRRALGAASVAPESVGYVECHGTGTALGDVVEVKAVSDAYGRRENSLKIGSIKSNIGHLNAAAGVPALMKAVWAVQDGFVAPSLKVRRVNPALGLDATNPISVTTKPLVLEGRGQDPRRVGVSGFGVGGSNMHLVVEQYRPQIAHPAVTTTVEAPLSTIPSERSNAAVLAPRDGSALPFEIGAGANLESARRSVSRVNVADSGPVRIAFATDDTAERQRANRLLDAKAEAKSLPRVLAAHGVFLSDTSSPRAVAAMFPGQGPHYPEMLADLARHFEDIHRTVKEADAIYADLANRPLSTAIWNRRPEDTQNDEDIHCATLVVNVALYRALAARGFTPDLVMGQSAGELSALVAAQSLELRDALRLMRARTQAVLSVPKERAGAMLAVPLGAGEVAPTLFSLSGFAVVAADNGPQSCLVSADAEGLEAVQQWCREQGVEATRLAVSHGYHSELIADAVAPYREALAKATFRTPRVPVVSTITGSELTRFDLERLPDLLAEQLVRPVRLADAVRAAAMRGTSLFIECGPKRALSTFVDAVLADRNVLAVPTCHPKVGEVAQFHRAWAALWTRDRAQVISEQKAPLSTETEIDAAMAHLRAALCSTRSRDEAARLLVRVQQDLVTLTLSLDEVLAKGDAGQRVTAPPPVVVSPLALPLPERAKERPTNPASWEDGHVDAGYVEDVSRQIVAAIAKRTGLPPGMFDFDIDLERELGIDTVKQIAAIAEVREALGLTVDEKFRLRDHPTIRLMAEELVSRLSEDPKPPAVDDASEPPADAPFVAHIRALIVEALVQRTGYPEDMLEDGLDLEADLGIDTVKQVAAFGDVREKLGLEVLEGFRLRDFPTLGAVVEHFVTRMEKSVPEASSATPSTSSGNASQTPSASEDDPARRTEREKVRTLLVNALVEKTGYPEEMLEEELDLEADLGIDTVKQVAAFGKVREELGLDVEDGFRLRDFPTLGSVVRHFVNRLAADRHEENESSPAPASSPALASSPAPASSPSASSRDEFHEDGLKGRGTSPATTLAVAPVLFDREASPFEVEVQHSGLGHALFHLLQAAGPVDDGQKQLVNVAVSTSEDGVCKATAATGAFAPEAVHPPPPMPGRALTDAGKALIDEVWAEGAGSLVAIEEDGGHSFVAQVSVSSTEEFLCAAVAAAELAIAVASGERRCATEVRNVVVQGWDCRTTQARLRVALTPNENGGWAASVVIADGALRARLTGIVGGPSPKSLEVRTWRRLRGELSQT